MVESTCKLWTVSETHCVTVCESCQIDAFGVDPSFEFTEEMLLHYLENGYKITAIQKDTDALRDHDSSREKRNAIIPYFAHERTLNTFTRVEYWLCFVCGMSFF